MQPLIAAFMSMVRIDSESGQEDRFIEYLRGLFEDTLGATCETDAFGNLIARVGARGSHVDEPVMLVAHGDTVKPGVGIEPVLEDGVIRSAGETILGADNKAGIAEILEAVRLSEPRPPVEIVITRCEEVGLKGSRALELERTSAKHAYVIDAGAPHKVILGGPTHINLDVEIFGKAAHAADPASGLSAIRVASDAIGRLPEGQIDEQTTANVGTIQGGRIRNGVPDYVVIQAECRSVDHKKALAQAETMCRVFEETARAAGAQVKISQSIEYEAVQLPESSPVVQDACAAITAAGLVPETKVGLGGTDALVLGNRGLHAVALGYGGRGGHSTAEHIYVQDMEKVVEILRLLLARIAMAGS
jgi:tripeptide aminopeptidase